MLERLILKLALGLTITITSGAAIALGVVFVCTALASALTARLGPVNGYLAAGGIILFPFLIAAIILATRLGRPAHTISDPAKRTIARSLFSAVAREAPWVAAVGAAAVAAGAAFLNRKNS